MAGSLSAVDLLGSGLHVWPDFHGNRSPLADPTLRGMVREEEEATFPPLNPSAPPVLLPA